MRRDPFRVVVVGAGGISPHWFGPLAAEGVQVAAVVDLDVEMAAARVEHHGLDAIVSDDLCWALDRTNPDFVLDLTVPAAHESVTIAALERGYHVLGEKPMAQTVASARRMIRSADRAKRVFMVSQSRRWVSEHVRIQRAIRAGRIGPVTNVECSFYLAAHFGDFRDLMPSPLIGDMAIHHFDLVRFFTGLDAKSVYAVEYNPQGSWYAGSAAAAAIVELDGGVVFTYGGSWASEGCHTGWAGDWRIVGEKGTIVFRGDETVHAEAVAGRTGFIRPKRQIRLPAFDVEHAEMHGSLREFLRFLRTGRLPQSECHENFGSVALMESVTKSAATGRKVTVARL